MKGRKPKSSATRRLDGNPGRRPLNETEPQHDPVAEAFDEPPPELADNELAQSEWRRLAPILRKAKQVCEADRASLVALCVEWARYLEATKKVRQAGLVVSAPSGYPMPNPYLSIATKALQGCNKLWVELGLTPSSRSRVSKVGSDDGAVKSPLQQLQQRAAEFRRPVAVK